MTFFLLLVAFAVPCVYAQAKDRFDVGVDAGSSQAVVGSSIAFGASFGYRVRRYLDLSLNYQSIPHYEMTLASLSALGRYRMAPRFHLLGRVGIANWYESPVGTQSSIVTSGVDPLVGLGVSYRFSRRLSGRLQYQLILAPSNSGLGGNFQGEFLTVVYHF
ncbi:outer membrane protein OmpA [mine drainage metagenome]|uniref:Outer membrane protein OmpA n=2 Tax=mine drainage metagenome TaxID=410659 RepID=T1A995_9ZZZZ